MLNCSKCKKEKEIENFIKGDKTLKKCKLCRDQSNQWKKDNIERVEKTRIDYSTSGRKKEIGHNYYLEHKEEAIKYSMAYNKKKYNEDPEYKIKECLRVRIYQSISQIKAEKSDTTMNLTGCTIKELKNYLWDNHGDWHIDHIKPICAFDLSSEEEQKRCFHFTNLQPLWAEDNLSKGGKYLI
jgi:hypothetical protein